ncbi:MAG: sulfite exporter TauE/SafE family protein [Silvanigrellaceae bacterium]
MIITPMFIVGILMSLLIGISLGLLGGGGSILTVPILHYVFGLNASESTALSLFVVGLTAAAGAVAYAKRGEIAWKEGIIFSIPSFFAVYATRRFALPAIPASMNVLNFTLAKDTLILLIFAVVMLLAAGAMLRPSKAKPVENVELTLARVVMIILEGIVVGGVTGFVGAGGGFLIVPALVILVGLDMKRAVGTSLVVIASKSLIGFAGDLSAGTVINMPVLVTVTSASLVGMVVGTLLVAKVSSARLKPAFGWFVLVMGTFILLKETVLK